MGMEPWIDFDRCDTVRCAAKGFREDAASRSDFQHGIARAQLGYCEDFPNDIGVDQEILAESFDGRGWLRAAHGVNRESCLASAANGAR